MGGEFPFPYPKMEAQDGFDNHSQSGARSGGHHLGGGLCKPTTFQGVPYLGVGQN